MDGGQESSEERNRRWQKLADDLDDVSKGTCPYAAALREAAAVVDDYEKRFDEIAVIAKSLRGDIVAIRKTVKDAEAEVTASFAAARATAGGDHPDDNGDTER